MFDGILLQPDNRLLGSSTHDFSAYGAQTSPALALRPVVNDAGSPASGTLADMSALASSSSVPAIGGPVAFMPATEGGFVMASPALANPAAAPIVTTPTLAGTDAPLALTSGSGWSPAIFAPRVEAPEPGASAEPAQASASAQPPLAQIDDLSPITLAAPSLALIDAVVSPALTIPTVGQLLETTDALVSTIPPVAQLLDTTEALASTLPDAVTGPLADLADTVGLIANDDLSGMLGADPPGGIATLVSLVSVSDVFDVGEPSGVTDSEALAPANDLLDSLAADLPDPPSLLGLNDDGDHHDILPDDGLLPGL